MAPDKTTDSVQVGVWCTPEFLKELDERRGDESRAKFILKTCMKAWKLKGKPRTKGRPTIKKKKG